MRPWNELPVYTRLTVIGLLFLILPPLVMLVPNIIDRFNEAVIINLVAIVLPLPVAWVVWQHGRWALAVAAVIALLSLLFNGPVATYGLDTPDAFFDFVPSVLVLVGFFTVLFGVVGSFLQRKQESPRTGVSPAERGALAVVLLGVAALTLWSAVASITGRSSVAAEDKVGAIDMVMKQVRFEPDRVQAPAGATATMVIDNQDLILHTFTIEELDLEYVLGPRDEVLVTLPALEPGQYPFTCEVPGHENMRGVLVVQ